ncbi:MAG: lysophospholipid acyltransferase family protein, partial [Desulfuromonadales bacterium]|nr:lysophospholipid acyltransferase family protein [Desulfuromonadales bacterium]
MVKKRFYKKAKNALKWQLGILTAPLILIVVFIVPASWDKRVGEFLGSLFFKILKRERNRAIENITASLPFLKNNPNWCGTERTPEEIAKDTFKKLGRTFLEIAKLCFSRGDYILKSTTFSDLTNYYAANEKGKGLIFASAHLGNWEILGMKGVEELAPLSLIVKKLPNPLLNSLTERLRTKYGCGIIYADGAAKKMFLMLRNKGIIGILVDQVVPPSEGELVNFLGRPAWMTKSPPAISAKTGAPIIPFFMHRDGNRNIIDTLPAIE